MDQVRRCQSPIGTPGRARRPPSADNPLDTSRDVAIREAALDLLTEIGYDRLTMDAVAARAHARRRRSTAGGRERPPSWSTHSNCSKGTMLEPDAGSLAGDFEALGDASCSARESIQRADHARPDRRTGPRR